MNFKNKLVFLTVIIILIFGLIVFLPKEVRSEKISSEVEKELENNKEVPVIVRFSDSNVGIAKASISFKSAKEELKNKGFKEKINLESFNAVAGNVTEEVLKELKENPNVESIQFDHRFSVALADSTNIINATLVHTFVLKNNITGLGFGICILDTGVNYSHVDFGGCFGNGCRIVDGYDYINLDSDPYDDHGHGTHVTGIVNKIVPNANLIHIKVLSSGGGGTESGISSGIDWCVSNKTKYNITAISMSIGSDNTFSNYCDSTFPTLTAAINNAIKNNITVFAASGNNGVTSGITSPACIKNATSVGGTNKDDTMGSYTNRNDLLDLLAPGSDITSTSITGGYVSMSGTSMATPHAAGVVALLQQYDYEQNNSYLDPYKVQSVLNDTGRLIDSWRRINIKNAIASIDIIFPELYLDKPTNGTIFNSMNNISLNYTAKDRFLNKVWYNIDSLNNISLLGNTSFFPLGGNHILTIFANDTSGSTNFTKISFGLDIPRVTLNIPINNYNALNGNLIFNCSASDLTGLVNVSLLHNLTGQWLINQTKGVNGLQANVSFSLNLSGNLTFGWNCISYDTSGFFALDENRTIRVNFNSVPVVNSFFPNKTNVTIVEPQNQSFNISYGDADGDLLSVKWYLNNNVASETDNYTFYGSYSSSRNYNVTVVVNDSLSYNSTFWNLTVENLEFCGDNVKNSTEACDGSDFGGDSCSNRGFNSGSLSCNSACSSIDANACKNEASGGGGGGGGGGTPLPTEKLEPAPFLESSPGEELKSEKASENLEVAEEPQEEKVPEPEKVEIIKKEGILNGKLRNIIIGSIVGLLIFSSLIFFFRKEYMLIKSKNKKD